MLQYHNKEDSKYVRTIALQNKITVQKNTGVHVVSRIYYMLFYFITAVRTSEIKYSIITVERRYVCMLIYRGNRQFDLRNKSNVYMHLCLAVCASRET